MYIYIDLTRVYCMRRGSRLGGTVGGGCSAISIQGICLRCSAAIYAGACIYICALYVIPHHIP